MATSKREAAIRRQIHVIHDELSKLGKDVARFNDRVRKLTAHIKLVHDDATEVSITSEKLAKRFSLIKAGRKRKP